MAWRAALLLACALCAVPGAWSSCQSPITPEEGFACTANDANYFRANQADTWWDNDPSSPPFQYVPGIDFINDYYSCCRVCVWSFGFPTTAPVLALHGDTLDCTAFRSDFTRFDQDSSNYLNTTELTLYLTEGANKYLSANKLLNSRSVYFQTDLNRNGKISLEEFLVLRHFWAVTHTVKTGPLRAADNGNDLQDGPLGGLFLDYGQVKAWFTVANSINIEKYLDNFWDTSLTREPTDEELLQTMQRFDVDGSTRISIEEHYFRVFADRNGDGWVSKDEYYLSLYQKVNPAGKADNPFLFPINFILHDWNGDGRITFLERKFVAADLDNDAELTAEEWVAGDFPRQFGPFEGHAVSTDTDRPVTINAVRYFFYTIFHECASQGAREYQTSFVESPWARGCIIDVRIEHFPPFVVAELNTTSPCNGRAYCNDFNNFTVEASDHSCSDDMDCTAGRGCSYFGVCHEKKSLEPSGEYPRWRRWSVAPTGYSIAVLQESMVRLRYNYTISLQKNLRLNDATAPVPVQGDDVKVWPPKLTFALMSSFESSRYTASENDVIDMNKYSCTKSLWPNDGFVVVVRTTPDVLSNQLAMWYMLGSASFINFVAVFFFFVLAMGHLFWFFERHANEDHFREFYAEGVMDGLWFAMVTVTTVGYGDKVPITGAGRFIGAFWMLFGLICFGLFGGQVINQLSELQAAADIQDVNGIDGRTVGILASTNAASLSTRFAFNPQRYNNMFDATTALREKRIDALLVPHSNILHHFREERMDEEACGNPLKIVGSPLLQENNRMGLHTTLCACDTCNIPQDGTSVYAAGYLANAISKTMAELGEENFLAGQEDAHLLPTTSSEVCPSDHGFDLNLIIACIITLVIYACLSFFVHSKRTRPYALAIEAKAMHYMREVMFAVGIKNRSRKYLNADEDEEIESDDETVIDESARSQHIEKYVDKLQALCLGHNADIRRLQAEVMEGRKTMSRVINFFTTSGAVVLCLLCAVYTTLVIVWGSEIRLTELGAPDDALPITNLEL